MTSNIIQVLQSKPGIQRDGTTFNSQSYTDGVWCRFYMGLPRKIGGYVMLGYGNEEIIRSLTTSDGVLGQNQSRAFLGRSSTLATLDYNPTLKEQQVVEINVTPPTEPGEIYKDGLFKPYTNNSALINIWQFQPFTINAGTENEKTYMIVQVAPNGANVANTFVADDSKIGTVFYQIQGEDPTQFLPLYVATPEHGYDDVKIDPDYEGTVGLLPPYIGTYKGGGKDPDTGTIYSPVISIKPTGGLVAVPPFLFIYGASGVVAWSKEGNPSCFPNDQVASIAGSKIVIGKNTRGGGTASVLFWSLNSIVLGQYSPTTTTSADNKTVTVQSFSFNTLRDDISILSAACVVEYNQNFYWVGNNQFYVYTGVVQQLPNSMNSDWFFNHINPKQTSKVWGLAISRYNEIWWFYPRGEAKECTHAIIFNVLLNIWYDTEIPRASGTTPQLSSDVVMADSSTDSQHQTFGLWRHEIGTDKVYPNQSQPSVPILSSFTTSVFNLGSSGQPDTDTQILTRRMEPDFDEPFTPSGSSFTNPMSFQLLTRAYANSPLTTSTPYEFTNKTPYLDVLIQGGLVQYQFTSNVLGGNYQCGKILLTYSPGDVRRG